MKRVNVNIPPEVLETSRALQAANRDRLVRRERDERTRREAERQARKAREEQARSSAGGKKDPKNRGVPDVEDPPFFPLHRRGQKFKVAGAYCQIEQGGIRIFSGNRGAEAFLAVPGLATPFSYAFPSFVMAMPGGEGRTVLTFYFDTWDYSKLELPYEFGSPYYESEQGEVITVIDKRVRSGEQYQQNWFWRIPRQFTGPNYYIEWKASYSIVDQPKQAGLGSRLAIREKVEDDIDNALQVIKSCVVTKDRVLLVSTPQTLVDKLRRIYPWQRPSVEIKETPVTGQVEQITEVPYFETEIINGISVTELYVAATRTMIDIPPGKLEAIYFDYGTDPNFYNRLLLSSYGYGNLLNKEPSSEAKSIKNFIFSRLAAMKALRKGGLSGQDNIKTEIERANENEVPPDDRGFATPAVFAFLSRYSGEFNGIDEEPAGALDYRYISENYFPDEEIKYMLSVGFRPEGAAEDETQNLFYFRPLEDYSSFQVPPIPPKRSQGAAEDREMSSPPLPGVGRRAFNPLWDWKIVRDMKIAGYRDDLIMKAASASVAGPIAINTWDWGRPLACILELLSLGFSPAALMLTAEELEAVANATPADRSNFSSSPP